MLDMKEIWICHVIKLLESLFTSYLLFSASYETFKLHLNTK